MGLLNILTNLFSGRSDKKIEKCARIIKNPKAVREDRIYALEFFKNVDEPDVAVPALLQRFEYSLEHGINDAREKETAMEAILKHGPGAVPFVKEHLAKTTRIAWPIKILTKLTKENELVHILLDSLDYNDVSFDQAIVDKNYDILCYLSDYKISGMANKVSHFINDPDERVRFAAVEVLVTLEEPNLEKVLGRFIEDDSAENRRLRATVIDAFVKRKWLVEDPKKFGDAPIVEGVFVTKQGHLERRNI